jgi:hypothetical protein
MTGRLHTDNDFRETVLAPPLTGFGQETVETMDIITDFEQFEGISALRIGHKPI